MKKVFLKGGSLAEVFVQGDVVVKTYSGHFQRGYEKLRKEARYLQSLPKNIQSNFPRVLWLEDTKTKFSYAMPYYKNLPSLRDLAFGRTKIAKIWGVLKNVLDFCDVEMYTKNKRKTPRAYLVRTHFRRVETALDILSSMVSYSSTVSSHNIILNGEKLRNTCELLQLIKKDKNIQHLLTPEAMTLFHGNFHIANILSEGRDFMLIDPRGEISGAKDYDISKMFCHFYMRYDEIFEDLFTLKTINETEFQLEMKDYFLKKRYDFLQRAFIRYELSKVTNKKQWVQKILLLSGFHAISLSSYHARKKNSDKKRVLAYYLSGVKLLNDGLNGHTIKNNSSLFSYE